MIFSHGGNTACVGEAFWKLFLALIDPDLTRAGEEYERLRQKLIKHFERRQCYHIDECVEETLHRVCQKISAGTTIRNLPGFALGVASKVALEYGRHIKKFEVPPDDDIKEPEEGDVESAATNSRCMKACLQALPPENQQLILRYYRCDETQNKRMCRERLADKLGYSYGNLVVRVHRIRSQLNQCREECLQKAAIS